MGGLREEYVVDQSERSTAGGALKAFMDSLVDYAGLFPPAALSVPAAVAEYAGHRQEAEAWMLGRFIAPAGRLVEIGTAARPHLDSQSGWPFSVLVGGRDSAENALAAIDEQAAQISEFESNYIGQVKVECLEAPIALDGAAKATEFIPALLSRLRDHGLGGRDLFLEVLPGSDDAAVLGAISAAAPDFVGDHAFTRLGAKLRCGGVTPEAFPSCERIAAVIQTCAQQDLPLKCTAGLHHPVRHQATEPDVVMHGFLNVFGAGLLAWALRPELAQLVECVAETDPSAFTFTGETFAWRDLSVDIETMLRIRRRSLFGFGSCSFTEPRSDLQDLGIL